MRWNPARQIGGIEYQCLAIVFLAAGQRIFAVQAPKSTAQQVRKKSRFFNNGGPVRARIGGSEWLSPLARGFQEGGFSWSIEWIFFGPFMEGNKGGN
jgi:hypothetical protein